MLFVIFWRVGRFYECRRDDKARRGAITRRGDVVKNGNAQKGFDVDVVRLHAYGIPQKDQYVYLMAQISACEGLQIDRSCNYRALLALYIFSSVPIWNRVCPIG